MPGVRIDRLLASTAVVLLLAGAAGRALAGPMTTGSHRRGCRCRAPADAASRRRPPMSTPRPPQSDAAGDAGRHRRLRPTPRPQRPRRRLRRPQPAAGRAAAPRRRQRRRAAALDAAPMPRSPTSCANLASGKFDRIVGSKKDRATIDAFYSGRDYAPLWITDGEANERAKAAIAYLGHVDADGLDPADYPVPNFAALSDPAALAEAELKLDR